MARTYSVETQQRLFSRPPTGTTRDTPIRSTTQINSTFSPNGLSPSVPTVFSPARTSPLTRSLIGSSTQEKSSSLSTSSYFEDESTDFQYSPGFRYSVDPTHLFGESPYTPNRSATSPGYPKFSHQPYPSKASHWPNIDYTSPRPPCKSCRPRSSLANPTSPSVQSLDLSHVQTPLAPKKFPDNKSPHSPSRRRSSRQENTSLSFSEEISGDSMVLGKQMQFDFSDMLSQDELFKTPRSPTGAGNTNSEQETSYSIRTSPSSADESNSFLDSPGCRYSVDSGLLFGENSSASKSPSPSIGRSGYSRSSPSLRRPSQGNSLEYSVQPTTPPSVGKDEQDYSISRSPTLPTTAPSFNTFSIHGAADASTSIYSTSADRYDYYNYSTPPHIREHKAFLKRVVLGALERPTPSPRKNRRLENSKMPPRANAILEDSNTPPRANTILEHSNTPPRANTILEHSNTPPRKKKVLIYYPLSMSPSQKTALSPNIDIGFPGRRRKLPASPLRELPDTPNIIENSSNLFSFSPVKRPTINRYSMDQSELVKARDKSRKITAPCCNLEAIFKNYKPKRSVKSSTPKLGLIPFGLRSISPILEIDEDIQQNESNDLSSISNSTDYSVETSRDWPLHTHDQAFMQQHTVRSDSLRPDEEHTRQTNTSDINGSRDYSGQSSPSAIDVTSQNCSTGDILKTTTHFNNVPNLTGSTYGSFIKDQDLAVVMFYNSAINRPEHVESWVKYHYLTAPRGTNLAFAYVDCAREAELCAREEIATFPLFKLYSGGYLTNAVKDSSTLDYGV